MRTRDARGRCHFAFGTAATAGRYCHAAMRENTRDLEGLKAVPAWGTAAILALAYLLLDPHTGDHAAQLYRVGLFEREGPALYDSGWYAGIHLPAYSMLYPPLGALVGARVAGALAIVAAAALFERLCGRGLAAHWFAFGAFTLVVAGRLTFTLGVAIGVAALLAVARERTAVALLLGVATALASPVAALFLALCAAAVIVTRGARRAATAALAGAGVSMLALAIAFPQPGDFPFAPATFWPQLAFTLVAVAALTRGRIGALRRDPVAAGAALYAVLLLACFTLDSGIGGNATRLGALAAGPALAAALHPGRRMILAIMVLPALYWQLSTPINNYAASVGDPSVHAGYFTELERGLAGRHVVRLEIPLTRNHWETAYVASRHPLARGWLRQADRDLNPVFYDGRLDRRRYYAWLRATAVTHVAVPDAPLDRAGRAEARLIARGMPELEQVWRGRHWRVYAVRDPQPLLAAAGGAMRLTRIDGDSVEIDARRRASARLALRWTPYWKVVAGRACVSPDGGFTRLTAAEAGRIRLVTRFAPGRIRSRSASCG